MQKSARSLQQPSNKSAKRSGVRNRKEPQGSEISVEKQPYCVSAKSMHPSNGNLDQCKSRKKSVGNCQNQLPLNIQLLKDLVKIIKVRKTPYIKTRDLIVDLCADPLKPWVSYFRGSNITARHLSALLKPFGVSSCCIYYKDGNAKGYNCQSVRRAYRSANADRRSH
ncbi:MAG: DUF3631 domain-containing protein [Chlorobium sp.]|nr:DUF3631 domain-containing protein [Chlorobium sp.]